MANQGSSEVPFWVPLAALVAGYFLNMVADVFRDKRTAERDKTARASERETRRDEFQRQTILDLQTAMMDYLNSAVDLAATRSFNKTRDATPSPPLSAAESLKGISEARTRVTTLRARVIDDELRGLVKGFQQVADDHVSSSLNDRESETRPMLDRLETANDRINVLLKTRY